MRSSPFKASPLKSRIDLFHKSVQKTKVIPAQAGIQRVQSLDLLHNSLFSRPANELAAIPPDGGRVGLRRRHIIFLFVGAGRRASRREPNREFTRRMDARGLLFWIFAYAKMTPDLTYERSPISVCCSTVKVIMKLHHIFAAVMLSTFSLMSLVSAQDKAPNELVANSGFEQTDQGFVTSWSVSPFLVVSSPTANSGAQSLKLETKDVGVETLATQDIRDFAKGKSYRLQYDVRADRFGVEYRAYIGLWKDKTKEDTADTPASAWVGGVDVDPWRQGNTSWQHVSVDFTPTTQANKMMVVLQMRGPGAVWFDNVSITPQDPTAAAPVVPEVAAPEPAKATAPAGSAVKITADRRFLLNGRPFFPIMIWGWTPTSEESLAVARDWGFNVVGTSLDAPHRLSDIGPYGTKLLLDAAQRQGLHVMATLNFNFPVNQAEMAFQERIKATEPLMPILRAHPATFGYTISDEPAWAGYDVKTFTAGAQWIKAQDAAHPIFVNHAPRNTIEELKKYNQFIDIAGSDIYPVLSGPIVSAPQNHSDLPNKTLSVVGDETRKNLAAVDNKKPIMQTLQGFEWTETSTFPTRAQSRFMAWDSIVAGATGVTWFQNGFPRLRPELKPVVREFAALQDVLAGGKSVPTKGIFAAPIQTIAYQWKGVTVLVAINPTEKAVQSAPDWKPTFAASTRAPRVLWENRSSAATESFAPFDVHIYTDAAKDADILRAGFETAPLDR